MSVRTIIFFRIFWLLMILLPSLVMPSSLLFAQTDPTWSSQQTIPGYDKKTFTPILIADQSGIVHAFTSQPINENEPGLLIMYNQWSVEQGWSVPNDILLSPYNDFARIASGFLDKDGVIHLIFVGGHEQGANIYYSWAPAYDAGNANAWAQPQMIGANAILPQAAALAGDENGNFVVLYGGNLEGDNALYATYSNDNAITWSEPQLVYSTYSEVQWPVDLEVYTDHSYKVHAVWNVVDAQGTNITGYYARFEGFADSQWSTPIELDQSVGHGVSVPSIVEWDGELIIIYNNGLSDEVAPVMWMRRSKDGGNTWSTPVLAFPSHRGRNGAVSFVIDSANTLHALFAQRTGSNPDIHGMWHSVWDGERWSQPEAVVSGPQRPGTNSLETFARHEPGFDPVAPRAVIVQGNTLFLAWRTDPGLSLDGVWYSYRVLDTPILPVTFLPLVPTPLATLAPALTSNEMMPLSTSQPNSSPTPIDGGHLIEPPRQANGAARTLLFGSIPALLLVLSVLVMQGIRQGIRQRIRH